MYHTFCLFVVKTIPSAALRLPCVGIQKLLMVFDDLPEGSGIALDPFLVKMLEPRRLESEAAFRRTAFLIIQPDVSVIKRDS